MRYHALACDYDGTLAQHGVVDAATIAALERLRASGRKLLLVTGRQVDDLIAAFPRSELFDRIVAENGTVVYNPATRQLQPLAESPPAELVQELERRRVTPLSVGRVIVATWEPNGETVLQVIRDLGLEQHVIFNKGAVMILPSGMLAGTGRAFRGTMVTRSAPGCCAAPPRRWGSAPSSPQPTGSGIGGNTP